MEFLLGNKNPQMLKVFEGNPPAHTFLADALESHTVYDAFLRLVARRGLPVPAAVLERDVSRPVGRAPRAGVGVPRGLRGHHPLLGPLRDVRGPRRRRGRLPALAVPAPADRAAHDRVQAGNRRLVGRLVPAPRARPHLLPRADHGADRDRERVSERRRTIAGIARAELDAADPLASYRDAFVTTDGVVAYLDGNSLGRPLRATRDRLTAFVDGPWGDRLIRAWDEEWMAAPTELGDTIARICLGAAPGQTVVADSTTVLLYKLVRAAVDAQTVRSRAAPRSCSTPTTSRPTGSSSRASPPSATSS